MLQPQHMDSGGLEAEPMLLSHLIGWCDSLRGVGVGELGAHQAILPFSVSCFADGLSPGRKPSAVNLNRTFSRRRSQLSTSSHCVTSHTVLLLQINNQ